MVLTFGVFQVEGLPGLQNWLLYKPPVARPKPSSKCVLFFPGDISDFAGSCRMGPYSIEALAWVVAQRFQPDDHLVVVRAQSFNDMFAVYSNFLPVDHTGSPTTQPPNHSAVTHLQRLLANLDRHIRTPATPSFSCAGSSCSRNDDENGAWGTQCVPLRDCCDGDGLASRHDDMNGDDMALAARPMTLVGFSKGGVVLNALMREGGRGDFWSRVDAVHFVDAGLNTRGVFPLTSKELETLRQHVSGSFAVYLHGTPRQLSDKARPWIGEEFRDFFQRGRASGIRFVSLEYLKKTPATLNSHFEALRVFATNETQAANNPFLNGPHTPNGRCFFDEWMHQSLAGS